MKQKRKVKSLIPQKKFTSKSLKTAGLVFLGSALYLASITLLSTSVAFGANEGAQAQDFKEFDWASPISDKSEVVYAARFATIDNLNNRIIDIFMNKDGVFYITPNPVIVNPLNENGNGIAKYNFVDTENKTYGHVLGGKNNYVYSNNVTIIAGEENKVNTGSDNATMLGGEKNTINQGNGVPSAIIGGSKNTIETGHEGSNIIIGGYKNTIKEGVSGSAILGGESNTIENNTSNAIIGGSDVTNDKNNVFAYSNENNFNPQNPNSFFLNMKKGVGINMEASGALNGLYVSGAVSLGDINIKSKPCNHSDNYGLEGKYKGCLVGCTKDGWKMFDRGKKCETICKDNINIFKECPRDAAIPDSPDDYTGFCMGLANTDNATQCPNLEAEMENYKNVVFETKLIDSERECPNSEDKCIFKCDDDYNLRDDKAGGSNIKKCYNKCTLPWKDANGNDIKIKHNDTVEAYNTDSVNCSNTDYIFPQNTAIVNVPISEYTTITKNGMLKAKNGHSYESCTNYTHKKTLVCKDGTLYIANGERATSTIALGDNGKWYGHETCTTKDYTCPTDTYNLNKTYITNKTQGNDTVARNDTDRSISDGTRGKYKLCLDWTPSVGNSECKVGTNGANGTDSNFHYQLIGCQDNYERFNDNDVKDPKGNRCMQKCTFTTAEGKEITKSHNESITLFKNDKETCPSPVCEYKTFKCNDGTWENEAEMSTYKYEDCTLYSQSRDEDYKITQEQYNNLQRRGRTRHSNYDSQTRSITTDNKYNCKNETRYKLIGCDEGYHAVSSLQYCVIDTEIYDCTKPDHSSRTHDDYYLSRSEKYGGYPRVDAGTHGQWWIGSWNVGTRESRDLCDWDCDPGYKPDGNKCIRISNECGSLNSCVDHEADFIELGYSNHKYEWTCQGNYCSACDEGYTEINGVCEKNNNGVCNNESTYPKIEDGRITTRYTQNSDLCNSGSPEGTTQSSTNTNQLTWICKGSGNGNNSETCHKCIGDSYWDDVNKKCVEPTPPPTPDEPECGNATTKEYTDSSKNNINSEACNPGTLDGYIGTSSNGKKFTRTCKNEDKTTSCEADRVACGGANGSSFTSQPTSNLCTNGSASFHNSDTEFIRSCTNGNASVENCRATKVPSCEPKTCSSSYNQTSCPSGKGCSSCTAIDSSCNSTTKYKVDCTINECSGYGLSACPSGKTCDSCNAVDSNCNTSTKYKVTGCSATTHTYGACSYEIPALSNLGSKTVINNKTRYTGSTTATCTNGNLSYSDETCRAIENATCGTLGYTCGEQTSYVKESNKFDTMNSTERIWKCTSKDGIDSNTCTYSCPSGQKLVWTGLHKGTCVTEDIDGKCGDKYKTCANGGRVTNTEVIGNQSSVRDSGTKGWKWECKGKGNGTTATCTAFFECNGKSANPSCKGSCGSSQCSESYCDASQAPLYGCKVTVEQGECDYNGNEPGCKAGTYDDNGMNDYGTQKMWKCRGASDTPTICGVQIKGGTIKGTCKSTTNPSEGEYCKNVARNNIAYDLSVKDNCNAAGARFTPGQNYGDTKCYFGPQDHPFATMMERCGGNSVHCFYWEITSTEGGSCEIMNNYGTWVETNETNKNACGIL